MRSWIASARGLPSKRTAHTSATMGISMPWRCASSPAARAAGELAQRHGIEMPIVAEVGAVLFEGKPLAEAIHDLMRRGARDQLSGVGLGPAAPRGAGADRLPRPGRGC